MSKELENKHAVITGGGTGIGAAIADYLDRAGVRVTLMGRREKPISEKSQKLKKAQAISVDVTNPESVERGFKQAYQGFGTVDILINNAGQAIAKPFAETSVEEWQNILQVNLSGVFFCTKAVLPGMRENKWGRIINISSTAGLKGYANVSAYGAAKHGVIGMTKALALETAREGITVNSVCPGYTQTEIVEQAIDSVQQKTGKDREGAIALLTKSNPQKCFVQPEEVASTVLWLCLKESSAITGQSIAVAGGEVM